MGKVYVQTERREEEIQALQEVITLIHSRYGWTTESFNFENCDWSEKSLDEDRIKMKALRKKWDWELEVGKSIESDMDNLALCLKVARLIYKRYEWVEFSLNFPTELTGFSDEIIEQLKDDFNKLYFYRHNHKIPQGVSANYRVFSTLEGLMFHTVRSMRPFSVKRETDAKRLTRVMRCLEGLLYQILITMDPDFKPTK